MKLRTARLLMVTSFIACAESLFAQVYQNPLEWMATAEGNDATNKEISSQIKGQTETAVLQILLQQSLRKFMNGKGSIVIIRKLSVVMLHR